MNKKLKTLIKTSVIFGLAAATLSACNAGSTSSNSSTTPTVYIADSGERGDDGLLGVPNIYQYTYINDTLTYVGTVESPGGPFAASTSVAYNNGYVYATYTTDLEYPSVVTGKIYIYQVAANGNLTYTGESMALPNNNAPMEIVFNPNGQYAYVADFESGGVWQYTVGANGILENPVQTAPIGGFNTTNAGSVSINNGYLYTTLNPIGLDSDPAGTGAYAQIFKINTNGSLTAVESQLVVPSGEYATKIVFQNGIAYVGEYYDNYVYSANINNDGTFNFVDNFNTAGVNNPVYGNNAYSEVSGLATLNGTLYINEFNDFSLGGDYQTNPFAYMTSSMGIITNYNHTLDIPTPVGVNNQGFYIASITQNY